MRPPRVFLIGLPGVGKSTYARKWATLLGVSYVDTDEEIIRRTGRSIPEWFAEGERTFRNIEAQTIDTLLQEGHRGIWAIGGGYPAAPGRVEYLRQHGYVVWVDLPVPLLMERLEREAGSRPLLLQRPPLAWVRLFLVRRHYYRAADLHWPVEQLPEATLLGWVERRLLASSNEKPS